MSHSAKIWLLIFVCAPLFARPDKSTKTDRTKKNQKESAALIDSDRSADRPGSDRTDKKEKTPDRTAEKFLEKFAEPRPESDKTEKKDTPADKEFSLDVRITLGDGRTLKGVIRVKAPERINLSHEADGIQYEKTVGIAELASVEITKWKGKFKRENKNGMVYEFEPDEIRVRLRDGSELKRGGGIFPFLKQFRMENKSGTVSLFSFWVDLKRPDGTWYTGLSGADNGGRVISHPDTVRKIDFDR